MTTQAYFQNIRKYIKDELSVAESSIYVAVAWFTDRQLFKILCDKAKLGVEVHLIVMDDDITRNCSLRYEDLIDNGGKLYQVSESFGTLMHHKFCVIDEKTIITGSYNWSVKASSNHENITITYDAEALAISFVEEFKKIKETYHGKDPLKELDLTLVNKRLEVIKGLIELGDLKDTLPHISKLNEYLLPDTIRNLVNELENGHWEKATLLISEHLRKSQAITVYDDFRVNELRWQIKYLELEILALENEKVTIEKIISDFVHTYTLRFGELMSKILRLKKEKLKSQGNKRFKEYQKAEEAFNEFEEEFNREKEKEKNYTHLSDEEKEDLKKKYRKAAALCHPNGLHSKFQEGSEEMKKAEELYIKLKEAYDNNDLATVTKILENLEKGIFEFQQESGNISSKREILEAKILNLRGKIEELLEELRDLRKDKIYLKILNIENFETYFEHEESLLKKELNNLENEQ